MKKCTIDELKTLYSEAESIDQELFSWQRSNLLLVAGEHYSSKKSKYWNRIRTSNEIPAEQKIRLTKNHIQKITKTLVNNITTYAPSVKPVAHNERERKDQKAAELNDSVWQDLRARHKMRLKTIDWANDFIGVGECAVKIFWDPMAGKYQGEEPVYETDPDTGQPAVDANMQPIQTGTSPKFSGDFVYERVYGFNLLRSPRCQFMGDGCPWIIRKLVDLEELKSKVGEDPDKLRYVQEASKSTYDVFDNSSAGYSKTKGQCLLMEFYYPVSAQHPQGYYYIATESGILWEGELPFGIWPIAFEGYDEIQTSPRKMSIIKQLRPYQIEINRTGSKMAEHQITVGDDKIMVQNGSKVTNGAILSGVRTFNYTGTKPEIMAGRSGDQYLAYMQQNISEMYDVANLVEDSQEKAQTGAVDPFAILYQSIRNKKKFSIYAEKFESFLSQICFITLELARQYYSEETIVPAIGREEIVNIPEFKNSDPLCYQIKLEPTTDDPESQMGKQMIMNHIIQYVGPQMAREDIGKVLSESPFGNWKKIFSDFTLKTNRAENMILALDRGEQPQPNKYDDAKYMISKLVDRMTQADFIFLDQGIQANYESMVQIYDQQAADQEQKILAAEKGYIPSGGPRVKADIYVPSPNSPTRTERATFPTEALVWLIDQLANQGSSQDILRQMNQGAVSDISSLLDQKMAQAMPSTQQPGAPTPQPGQPNPGVLQ